MRIAIGLTAALAATLAAVAPAAAATPVYDAFDSFTGTQLAGNFGWVSAENQTLTSLGSVACVIDNTICLGLAGGAFNLPGVFKSTGIPSTTHPYMPADRLLVHPGAATSLIGFFVAPEDGVYSFEARLDALTSSTTVGVFALTDASGTVNVFDSGFLGTLGQARSFSGSFALATGRVIGIGINNAGNFAGDSTGLRFTVTRMDATAVPEPASWALLIGGFGLVGATLRGRKTAVVSA